MCTVPVVLEVVLQLLLQLLLLQLRVLLKLASPLGGWDLFLLSQVLLSPLKEPSQGRDNCKLDGSYQKP